MSNEILSKFDKYLDYSAHRLVPSKCTIDKSGRSQEDYRQLLLCHLLEVKQSIPEDINSMEAWMWRSVHNRELRCYRELQRANARGSFYCVDVEEESWFPSTIDHGFENRAIARQLLARLRGVMPYRKWQLLMDYIEAGSVTKAWKESGSPGRLRTYSYQVKKVRSLAKAILGSISMWQAGKEV